MRNLSTLLGALALGAFLAAPAHALDVKSSTTPGAVPAITGPDALGDREVATNRADGRLFWKKPNGTLGTSTLLNALPSGRKAVEQGDGSDLSFTVPRTGGIARSAAQRLLDVVNVRDHEVKCDYSTDDTVKLQEALDAVHPVYGGDVWIPQGGCFITAPLRIRRPLTSLRGAGQFVSQIITNSSTFNAIEIEASYVRIEELRIAQYGSPTATQVWAIHDNTAGGSADLVIRNVEIGGGHSGIYSKGGRTNFWRPKITNIAPGTGVGIQLDGPAEARDIYAPYMENPGGQDAKAGIYITGGAGILLTGCQLQKMGSPLWVHPGPDFVVTSIISTGCYYDTSSGPSVFLDAGPDNTRAITNVSFNGSWLGSNSIGLKIKGVTSGVHLANSEIYGNSGVGIDTSEAVAVDGFQVTGSQIAGNGGAAILLGNNLQRITIAGNLIGPAGKWGPNGSGITIGTGVDYSMVVGNNLSANTGAALTNNSTATHNLIVSNNDGRGTLMLGTPLLPTTSTMGFPYMPVILGTPTGTPSFVSGAAPFAVAGSGQRLWVYINGGWKYAPLLDP
ncbi:right-handed parallel beta-helix repeat-containing protein [Methylobacterium isbiliense]|uniref:Right handed beta helix domain-containing protein n=1 Tax=Methylobacterium isbiliense TaxID=315478 RepID=A0ABQ4SE18_9HYPH|nr:right-handed parallel beta-helix repeat-containing protein [Methylobacterium isbiliense]MDN3627427.1 glycosyl hydrolase family 28-related protein [Methylobacterium isbiliense]GJE00646.1 hypothetical protein GMJLKIPL_2570 [Methylobacterium isbiliense]